MTPRSAFVASLTIVLGVTLAIGCAYYEDRVTDVGKILSPVDERVIHGDTQFSPAERAAAERACYEWATFTRGLHRLTIRWDLDDTNYLTLPAPRLYRVNPTPETGSAGGRVDATDNIWWVPDRCTDIQACIMHELGHVLGLQHVAQSHQVMSAVNPAHTFGLADHDECVRVGACRALKSDITTVTVTVDPIVPNVQPDYPAETYR
jgi:hypothetical protein